MKHPMCKSRVRTLLIIAGLLLPLSFIIVSAHVDEYWNRYNWQEAWAYHYLWGPVAYQKSEIHARVEKGVIVDADGSFDRRTYAGIAWPTPFPWTIKVESHIPNFGFTSGRAWQKDSCVYRIYIFGLYVGGNYFGFPSASYSLTTKAEVCR